MKLSYIILGTLFALFVGCTGKAPSHPKIEKETSKNPNANPFIWDFSEKKKYIYSYSQTVHTESQISRSSSISKSTMVGNGNLNVNIKSNNLAQVSITNMEMNITDFNQDGTEEEPKNIHVPTTPAKGMRPNGTFRNADTDALFDLLFPLPSRNLKDGESDSIFMKIPFNLNGLKLYSKGYNTMTFSGFKIVQERKCVVLESTIDVSKLTLPKTLHGKYRNSTKGSATYYFDLKRHCYVGADIHVVMDIMADSQGRTQNDTEIFSSLMSDNTFKIRLKRVE